MNAPRFRPVSQGAETCIFQRISHQPSHETEKEHRPTRIFAGEAVFLPRVADGTRTRDSQDHNLVLYQLNYSHHCRAERRERS